MRLRLAVLLLAAALSAACNDGNREAPTASPAVGASPEAVTPAPADATPGVATSASTGERSTPAPTPGQRDGDNGRDATERETLVRLARAIEERDVAALADLVALRELECVRQEAAEPRPSCSNHPGGEVPAGTVVEVFPISTCEREWLWSRDQIAVRLLDRDADFVAFLHYDESPFDAPSYPRPRDAALFEFEAPDGSMLGLLLFVEEGYLVFADWACGGGPETFIEGHPLYGTPAEVERE